MANSYQPTAKKLFSQKSDFYFDKMKQCTNFAPQSSTEHFQTWIL